MTKYDIYKIMILDFMRHGDSFHTAHSLACIDLNLSEGVEYKERLEKEINEGIK